MKKPANSEALIGATTGIGFVLLGLLATFLYPQPPRIDSAPSTVLRWVHGHRTGITTGMILGVFASLLFIWFPVYMQRRLAAAGRDFLGSVAYGQASPTPGSSPWDRCRPPRWCSWTANRLVSPTVTWSAYCLTFIRFCTRRRRD